MSDIFYTEPQLEVFFRDLVAAFIRSGFEIVEEPYIDYALCGFRATYVRRYLLQKPTRFCEGLSTTFIHVVGLPFGRHSNKMVIMAAPRSAKNEPISETLKLRIHIDEFGRAQVTHGDQQYNNNNTNQSSAACQTNSKTENPFNFYQAYEMTFGNQSNQQPKFIEDLQNYVSHIIEIISPGLIQLPTELKLEILKKLSLESIVRMSQVNNEFKTLIFQHGESLWRHLCSRDFNIKTINRRVHKNWMELYRDSYIMHENEICRKERALPGVPIRPALPAAPDLLQIEWLPGALQLPFLALPNAIEHIVHNEEPIALEFYPLRRALSLDELM